MAAFKKAQAECPADEVDDEVLAAIPGLTLQDLSDHLLVDWLLHLYATHTRHRPRWLDVGKSGKKMGKRSNFERREADFYLTPRAAVVSERSPSPVWFGSSANMVIRRRGFQPAVTRTMIDPQVVSRMFATG
jgi:hypothetical protein